MSMTVEYCVLLINGGPIGYDGPIDWGKSSRGLKSLGIPFTPWPVVSYGRDWLESRSNAMETESATTLYARVTAIPISECGWVLDRWYIRYTNGVDVISTEERPAGGGLETMVEIRPAKIGLLYWGITEVYPYFVYRGTGNLLATPTGDALLGYGNGVATPTLVIDL